MESGEVTLADDLGREPTLPVYELELQALDGGVPRLSTITHIQIQVPGNHPPVIAPNSTWMSVKEGLPPRTIVGRVVATDEDVRPEQLENELHFNIADKRGRTLNYRNTQFEHITFRYIPKAILRLSSSFCTYIAAVTSNVRPFLKQECSQLFNL